MGFWGWFWFLAICATVVLCVLDRFETLASIVRGVLDGFSRSGRTMDASGFGARAPNVTVSGRPVTGFGRAGANALRAAGSLVSFLWRWKVSLLAVALFLLGIGVLRSCSPFDFSKSRDTLRAERNAAQDEVRVKTVENERDVDIGAIAGEVRALRAQLREIQNRGRDELAAATPENEPPLDAELVAAWRRNLDRLCVARHDGHLPDTCGPGASPTMS